MTEIKQPKIRFKGYINDWEQCKLREVLDVSKEKNTSNSYTKEQVLSVSREAGTVNQIEYQGRSFAGADISGYKVVYPGQLIYTKSPLKDAPFGIFQIVTEEGIVSPLYAVYNSTEHVLASFVGLHLKSDSVATHYLSPLISKGAKNTINITDIGVLDGYIRHPITEEQQKIVTFFKTLDDTITLHQQKLEVTKQLKQTMLKKMFPKNGKTKPEIRFKGFTEDWEKFKVGKIFNDVISSGNRLPKDLLISGNTPYVIAQVENNGIFKYISKDTLDFSGKGMKLFNKNSITISIDNPEAIFVQKEDFYTSNIMRVLYNEKLTYEQHLIISEKIKEKTNGFGWGLKFSGPIIMNTEIFLPTDSSKEINFYELQMLGELFNNINSKIINLENKIIALNNLKGTMLKKMFI